MVIAEFQVGLALKGFASKVTVTNYSAHVYISPGLC